LADAVMAPYRVSSMAAYRPALKTISRALALLALLLWVIGSAAPMAGHAQALPGSSKTCLWELAAEGGTVFLLGSIHFMRADDYPLPPAMDAAYAACRAVVFETDIGLMQDPRVQTRMLELGMLPAGRNVFDTIGPETRRRIEAKLAETGLPVEIVAGFRPWMIALTLSALEFQRLGFDPNLGVDMHFFNKANADRKRIAALETVEFQLQLLAGMNSRIWPRPRKSLPQWWGCGGQAMPLGSSSCCSKPSTGTRTYATGCWLSATGPGPGRSQT
jgi:uncharacterized protein YbaP (TraB family)